MRGNRISKIVRRSVAAGANSAAMVGRAVVGHTPPPRQSESHLVADDDADVTGRLLMAADLAWRDGPQAMLI